MWISNTEASVSTSAVCVWYDVYLVEYQSEQSTGLLSARFYAENAADNHSEAEERAIGCGDRGVGLGQYGADHCSCEHGAWRCRGSLQPAECW